ncbi:hypothetical protein BN903_511 [Halorubrum sp. AJ67]|nr:hypothetical protein BN903_511 [Halorubrum sp. AJ67]
MRDRELLEEHRSGRELSHRDHRLGFLKAALLKIDEGVGIS